MFYVVPVTMSMKTVIYMGLRALLGCSTVLYKGCHPVATLPSDEGDYTSLSQNDLNFANQIINIRKA
eukprot:6214182-Pleurochrysis_carterae.AAC.1